MPDTVSISSSSAPDPAATSPPSAPRSSACASPASRRTRRSAAPASTSAASPARRCSTRASATSPADARPRARTASRSASVELDLADDADAQGHGREDAHAAASPACSRSTRSTGVTRHRPHRRARTRVEVSGDGAADAAAPARILIATGSAPIELPGCAVRRHAHHLLDRGAGARRRSRSACWSIGGGAIGLELGSVWSRLGAEVLVVELLDRIVPGMDRADGQAAAAVAREAGPDASSCSTTLHERRRSTPTASPLTLAAGRAASSEERCDVAAGRGRPPPLHRGPRPRRGRR